MSDEYFSVNKKKWNELARKHYENEPQHVKDFIKKKDVLNPLEIEEVGDVKGRKLLHLQCHFGMDTLSWNMRGALVTGVDFSEVAVANARDLAKKIGADATFINCNIYDLQDHLDSKFDIVFTSYGAISWLDDLDKWAGIIAHYLNPGGFFYAADAHPFAVIFDNDDGDENGISITYDYFDSKNPVKFDEDGSYMDSTIKLENTVEYGWNHSMSEIVNSLTKHGLFIDWIHEHPRICWKLFNILEQKEDGWWYWPEKYAKKRFPLLFSLKATKLK
ncbi:MAG: class I SAM-dependent methyltransferase [Candidatus Odinarchaeota archaeon]